MTLRKLQNFFTISVISCIAVVTFIAIYTKMNYYLFLALLVVLLGIATLILAKYGKCKYCGISLLARRGLSPYNTNNCPNCGSPINWDEKI